MKDTEKMTHTAEMLKKGIKNQLESVAVTLQLIHQNEEGGADNFLDQKEQGEEKHGIYGTRKRTSSRPI